MNNIYLVGFMGTGKSAVGKELAFRLKRRFVDLDELIELKAKMLVSEIFAKNGEPYFRKLEKQVLKETAKEKNFIVSCGGGVVIDYDNIKIMKKTGLIACLSAKPEVILKRVSNTSRRPLLNVSNPKARIELLLKLRSPYYARADKIIDTSKLSIKEVVTKIIKMVSSRLEDDK